MKLFISHASIDREIVADLLDLLQLGAGVPHHDIFCSSVSGNIPNGSYFVQHILSQLGAADLVVAVLSRAYLRSDFCIAEAGAAQVRQLAGKATFFSLLVPPVGFPDLDAVLYGLQSSRIMDAKELDGLRDRVTHSASNPPPTSAWNDKRDVFLAAIRDKVNRQIAGELLTLISLQDVHSERSTDSGITYKSKLRIVLRNDTGEELEATAPTWIARSGEVPIQPPQRSFLQLEGPRGWERDDWLTEETTLTVPALRALRAWIGLDQVFTDQDIRRRHETKRLGTLVLPVRIHGHDLAVELRL